LILEIQMAKQEKFIVTTPVAEIGYAWLRKPDTAFNKEGDYKADFFLTQEEAVAFCRNIESDPRAMVKGRAAKLKGTKVDGMIKFKSKQHAQIKKKVPGKDDEIIHIQPKLFYIVEGQTVPYPDDAPAPFGGSTGELELEVVPFEGFGGGLSLRLRAIRLHKVVSGGTGTSGAWADTPEGYTSSSAQYQAADGPEAATGDDPEVEEDDGEGEDDRW